MYKHTCWHKQATHLHTLLQMLQTLQLAAAKVSTTRNATHLLAQASHTPAHPPANVANLAACSC